MRLLHAAAFAVYQAAAASRIFNSKAGLRCDLLLQLTVCDAIPAFANQADVSMFLPLDYCPFEVCVAIVSLHLSWISR